MQKITVIAFRENEHDQNLMLKCTMPVFKTGHSIWSIIATILLHFLQYLYFPPPPILCLAHRHFFAEYLSSWSCFCGILLWCYMTVKYFFEQSLSKWIIFLYFLNDFWLIEFEVNKLPCRKQKFGCFIT